jgi:hypothetical protein
LLAACCVDLQPLLLGMLSDRFPQPQPPISRSVASR